MTSSAGPYRALSAVYLRLCLCLWAPMPPHHVTITDTWCCTGHRATQANATLTGVAGRWVLVVDDSNNPHDIHHEVIIRHVRYGFAIRGVRIEIVYTLLPVPFVQPNLLPLHAVPTTGYPSAHYCTVQHPGCTVVRGARTYACHIQQNSPHGCTWRGAGVGTSE